MRKTRHILGALKTLVVFVLIISCSKEQDGYIDNKEEVKLTYDKLFEVRSNPFYYISATADKAIDYNNDKLESEDISSQIPKCNLQTPLHLKRNGENYIYEYAMDDIYDDSQREQCKDVNSAGTFKIEGNNIIFTDSSGKIWDIWENVTVEEDGWGVSKRMRIYFSKLWISNDGTKNAIIEYSWNLDILHHEHLQG